jgi:outer membrane protein TolC
MNRLVYLLLLLSYSIGVAQEGGGIINLSLKEAIKIAREKNPAVSRAKFAVDAAYGRKLSGMSPAQPVLSLTYEEIPLAGRGVGSYGERTFSISQSIEFPTTTYMRGQYLSSLAGSAEWEYKSALNDVIGHVKESYTNFLVISEKARLAEENLEIAMEFAQKAELKVKAGEGTNLESLTAKVQQAQAETALKTAQKDLGAAYNELLSSMSSGQDAKYSVVDTLEYRTVTQSLDELTRLTLEKNPGL